MQNKIGVVKLFCCGVSILVVSSCAPGLGTALPVSRFPDPTTMVSYRPALGRVLVKPFLDGRTETNVGVINGRAVGPAEDVSSSVRGEMEGFLKAAGFDLGGIGSPSVSGTIEHWVVDVHPGFPTSKVESSAALTLEVADSSGATRFKGTYRGDFSIEHPMMNEDRIAAALGQAMAAAMQEALRDHRFTDLLRGSTL